MVWWWEEGEGVLGEIEELGETDERNEERRKNEKIISILSQIGSYFHNFNNNHLF